MPGTNDPNDPAFFGYGNVRVENPSFVSQIPMGVWIAAGIAIWWFFLRKK